MLEQQFSSKTGKGTHFYFSKFRNYFPKTLGKYCCCFCKSMCCWASSYSQKKPKPTNPKWFCAVRMQKKMLQSCCLKNLNGMETSLKEHRCSITLSWNFQPLPYCVHGAVEKLWIPSSVSFMPILKLRVCLLVITSIINIHWVGPCSQLLECVLWFLIKESVSCGSAAKGCSQYLNLCIGQPSLTEIPLSSQELVPVTGCKQGRSTWAVTGKWPLQKWNNWKKEDALACYS